MRRSLLLAFFGLALLRLGLWRGQQTLALNLCSRLLTERSTLTWEGTLAREEFGRWQLIGARLVDSPYLESFPQAVWIESDLPEAVARLGRQVRVTGPSRCQWPHRNPGWISDGLGKFKIPRLTIRSRSGQTVLVARPASVFIRAREGARAWLLEPFAEKTRTWIRAVWWGDWSELDPELRRFYLESGLAQLLALSGQHVVCLLLLAEGLLNLASRIAGRNLPWFYRRAIPVFLGLTLWFLSGRNPPITRTLVSLTAILYLRRRGLRARSAQVALTVAALLILLDPGNLSSPSFWLSVFCTYCLGEALAGGSSFVRYLWVSFWIPVLGFPATLFLFAKVAWLAPLHTWGLAWLWELCVIPLGFAAPLLVRFFPPLVPFLEKGWEAFVAGHLRFAALAGKSAVFLRPTIGEWFLWETALLTLMLYSKKRLFDDASSIAFPSYLRGK